LFTILERLGGTDYLKNLITDAFALNCLFNSGSFLNNSNKLVILEQLGGIDYLQSKIQCTKDLSYILNTFAEEDSYRLAVLKKLADTSQLKNLLRNIDDLVYLLDRLLPLTYLVTLQQLNSIGHLKYLITDAADLSQLNQKYAPVKELLKFNLFPTQPTIAPV
jgi:hypothetical protein